MAADRKSDQGSKEEIAKGMAEAGKGEVGKAGGEAARRAVAAMVPIRARSARACRRLGTRAKGSRGGAKSRRSCGSARAMAARRGPARRLGRVGPDRGAGAGGQPATSCTSRGAGEDTAGDHAGRAADRGPGHGRTAGRGAGTLRGRDRPGRPGRGPGHGAAPAGYRRCGHHAGHPAPGHAGWEPERPAEVSPRGSWDG